VEARVVLLAASSGMTKYALLACVADAGEADAAEMANALGVSYATSAMALLRLVRQHLASRSLDPHRGVYLYQLTDHGHARLAFFADEGSTPSRPATTNRSWRHHAPETGDHRMKRKKLHTGTYHCPACFTEFELVAEESLKCDQCGGPLAKGDLGEVWADDEEEEE
jgi:DNA-binding MarR family transcriptional regulator